MIRFFLLFLVLVSCSFTKEKAEVVIPKFPNPEHASMAGRDRLLYSLDSVRGFFDSLEYDAKGRLVKSKNNRNSRKPEIIYSYDSNNYPIRFYHRSSLVTNSEYSYQLKGDTLYQYVFYSELHDFIKNDTTIDDQKPSETNYYLIKDGRITQYIENGLKSKFHYDGFSRISRIESRNDHFERVLFYNYDGDGSKLRSVVLVMEFDTISVKKYNNGILYSLQEDLPFIGSEMNPIVYTNTSVK